MGYFTAFLQIVVALGLLNVWLIRSNKKTAYRGSNAITLKEEFEAYGLSLQFYYLVGFLKISSALFLLLGLWIPSLVFPSAVLVVFLMVGAIYMHLKVRDPFVKLLPAFLMLLLSIGVCIGSLYNHWVTL